MSKYKKLVPIIIPVLFFIYTVILQMVSAPAWYDHYDPEYIYLFNSLNMADWLLPIYYDHPGMPLQLFGTLIIKLFTVFNDTLDSVWADPEIYITTISVAINVLIAVTLYFVGVIFYKVDKDMISLYLIQITPIMFFTSIITLYRLMPEHLLVIFSMLAVVFFYQYIIDNKYKTLKKISLIAALGLTTKVIFLPIAVASVFFLEKKARIRYILLLLIFSLIITVPLYEKIKPIIYWFYVVTMGSGIYGQGSKTIISGSYLSDLLKILLAEPKFLFIFISSVLSSIAFIKYKLRKEVSWSILFIAISMAIGILMVAKHPQNTRYLIPVLSLSGFALFFIRKGLLEMYSVNAHKYISSSILIIALTMSTHSLYTGYMKISSHGFNKTEYTKHDYTSGISDCANILINARHKLFSKHFGHSWSGKKLDVREFEDANKYFIYDPNPTNPKIYHFFGSATVSELKLKYSCIAFIGGMGPSQYPVEKFDAICKTPVNGYYLIGRTCEQIMKK